MSDNPLKTESSHPNVPSVDQSDRMVPRPLRQSGDPGIEMLVSTRVRTSPFFHKSFVENGANGFTLTTDEDAMDVDVTMETSVADASATGAMVRTEEWEAVISAGTTE